MEVSPQQPIGSQIRGAAQHRGWMGTVGTGLRKLWRLAFTLSSSPYALLVGSYSYNASVVVMTETAPLLTATRSLLRGLRSGRG
jgi:hypothetical protein